MTRSIKEDKLRVILSNPHLHQLSLIKAPNNPPDEPKFPLPRRLYAKEMIPLILHDLLCVAIKSFHILDSLFQHTVFYKLFF